MPDTLRLAGALLAPHPHRESDLLDGDVYARLAASETVTGLWGFPAAGISIGEEAFSSPSAGVLAVGGDLQVGGSISLGGGPVLAAGSGDDLLITGDLGISGVAAIGNLASIDSGGRQALCVKHNTGNISILSPGIGAYIRPTVNTSTAGFAYGLMGEVEFTGTGAYSYVVALALSAIQNGANLYWLHGIKIDLTSYFGSGAVLQSAGIYVAPNYQGNKPSIFWGIYVQGYPGMNVVYGVQVDDFTGTIVHLLEMGPATPYLRLVGGGAPGANQTNLYLREGPNLRQVKCKAGDTLGAGDKVMVLV